MSPSEYKCPLCGYGFDKPVDECRVCPMARTCNVVCCPNCGYGFTKESRLVNWAKRLFRAGRRPQEPADKPKDKGASQ